MGDIFDNVAAQPQPNAPNIPATATAPSSTQGVTSGDIFDTVAAKQPPASTPNTNSPNMVLGSDGKMHEYTPNLGDTVADAASHILVGEGKGVAETAHTVGALAGKVMPNSWRDALGLPSSFKEPDYLQSTSGAETAGKVGENIAEFVMGDEALKGLQITERLGLAQKMAQMAKSSPYIAKILEHGLTAIRGGAVTVPQRMLHGATPTEALKTGAEATVLGAATGAAVEGASKLADVTGVSEKLASARRGGILSGGQPKLQTAISDAARTGTGVAAARTAAETAGHVNVPDQYKAIVDEAMKSEPAWTPESAKPIAKALGKDFEIRGSVAEGKPTDNDLDHYCPAKFSGSWPNSLKISSITHVWSKNDLNGNRLDSTSFRLSMG